MHRSHISVLFFTIKLRDCSERRKCKQRNLTSVQDTRILQQKLVGKHKRFVCYKRGKFKGTGEAEAQERQKQNRFASLFNVSPRRGLNGGEDGFK